MRRISAAECAKLVPHAITEKLLDREVPPLSQEDLERWDATGPKLVIDFQGDELPPVDRLQLYHQYLVKLAAAQPSLMDQACVLHLAEMIHKIFETLHKKEQLPALAHLLSGEAA